MDRGHRPAGMGAAARVTALHLEVLPHAQQDVLQVMGPVAGSLGFYLGGGTAVALHLGHRRSADFDWFTPDEIADPLVLAGSIRDRGVNLEVVSTAPGTLHGRVNGVRSSFLSYRYPLLRPLVAPEETPSKLAALEDLACMKLAAVAQRGARKDFVDVAVLLERFSLPEMLGLFHEKYGIRDVGHVLVGLTYFDDAEREPQPALLRPLEWDDVKARVRSAVREYAG